MRGVAGIGVGVLVVAAAACGPEAREPEAAEPLGVVVTSELLSEGRRAYRKYCVQCHGFGGKGDGTSAAHLTPPPRDHTNPELMDPISDLSIGEAIRYGGAGRGYPNMPAFPQVARDELVALVAYTRSLSRPEVSSVDVGDLD